MDTGHGVLAEAPSARSTMFSWFGGMTKGERRTFWGSFGGFGLDAMDIVLYSFAIPTLMTLWSMSRSEAGTIATTTLLVSALGGWLGGILSDRFGRLVTLQVTIVWFSVFTALCGLTSSFESLLVVRALQGLGFGAEWAVGAALIGEMVRPQHRGKALGFVQSAYAVGWGAAVLVYTICFQLLPEHLAWRALFFVGFLPAGFVLYLRKYVPADTPSPTARSAHGKRHDERFAAIFAPDLLRTTIFASLLSTGVQGGYYAVITWLPTYLQTERHLSVLNSSGYLAVVIGAAWLGYAAGAYCTDLIGRRPTFVLFSVCTIIATISYTVLPIGNTWTLFLGFPLGFFSSGTYSGLGAYFTELFPTRVRGSGMGFSYNFGRAVGATFPFIVGQLSTHISLAMAIGIFTTSAYAIVFLCTCILPETNGKALEEA
ncbi:Predicted arabinose efflux permease, MFS family [Methylobacterium sp. ap11]|uniref:MFS transporter n=1 Tax=Methylobacterium sp. ap11 TaxID=1761799 RepID=UPI0008CBE030|nr:MFS transporter [Methylobacterium sp. ap11]SEP28398.1 Predicted arabinose efflux permease, MFS family [Methylobacterium sp. ap11]